MEERVWFVEHISEVVSVRMSFVGWRMKMLLMSGSRINRLIFAVRKKRKVSCIYINIMRLFNCNV